MNQRQASLFKGSWNVELYYNCIYFVLIGEIKTFPPALDVYLSVCLLALLVGFFWWGRGAQTDGRLRYRGDDAFACSPADGRRQLDWAGGKNKQTKSSNICLSSFTIFLKKINGLRLQMFSVLIADCIPIRNASTVIHSQIVWIHF